MFLKALIPSRDGPCDLLSTNVIRDVGGLELEQIRSMQFNSPRLYVLEKPY